jgi:hypothetical protein
MMATNVFSENNTATIDKEDPYFYAFLKPGQSIVVQFIVRPLNRFWCGGDPNIVPEGVRLNGPAEFIVEEINSSREPVENLHLNLGAPQLFNFKNHEAWKLDQAARVGLEVFNCTWQ